MKSRIACLAAPCLFVLALAACEDDGAMQVSGINPPAGHIGGEQPVEIRGKNFRQDIGYTVYFGNEKAGSVTIRSPEVLVVSSPKGEAGPVDVTVRADDGTAFLIREGFRYEDMGGSVVEGLGKSPSGKAKDSNLAF